MYAGHLQHDLLCLYGGKLHGGFVCCIQARKDLVALAQALVVNHLSCTLDKSEPFATIWASFAMEPFVAMQGRLMKFALCILHLFCADPPSGSPEPTNADVYWFLNYDGQQLFERGVRRVFKDAALWWSQEIADLKKTGGSTRLSQDKLTELKAILNNDSLDLSMISKASDILKEVRESTRSQLLVTLLRSFSVLRQHTCRLRLRMSKFDSNQNQ